MTNTNNEKILAGLHTFLARRIDESLAKGFFGHLLTTYKSRIELMTIAQGTKVLGLSKGRVEKIDLFIPNPTEQKKIAAFLTTVDSRITLLKEKKDTLEAYKKGVMQKLFNQDIRFKPVLSEAEGDDNGNDFPDWEEKKLGEVCSLQGGFAFKSNNFKNQGIPVLRISNISNSHNYIETNNMVYYDIIENDEKFRIIKGDLLVAMSGATTGKSSIYNLEKVGYLNQRVGLFKPKKVLKNAFLIQFVFSELFNNQLTSVLVAGAQPNLSGKEIEGFKIPFPSLPEQTKIANYLTALDNKIDASQQKIDASIAFKKGLLQKMFV
ncbi:MAG: restriction endonuclease subunit S [Polaribacter sp.]